MVMPPSLLARKRALSRFLWETAGQAGVLAAVLAKAIDKVRPTLAKPPNTPNETPINSPNSAGNPHQPGWDRKIHSL